MPSLQAKQDSGKRDKTVPRCSTIPRRLQPPERRGVFSFHPLRRVVSSDLPKQYANSSGCSFHWFLRACHNRHQPSDDTEASHKEDQEQADNPPVRHHRAVPHIKALAEKREVANGIAKDYK